MQKELITELFDILEKTAGEADQLETENARLIEELDEARKAPKKEATAKPVFTRELVEKLAGVLLLEGFLPKGMEKSAAADLICRKPDTLADLMIRVVTPPMGEGVPVGAEKVASHLPNGAKIVTLGGRQLIDHDGFSNFMDLS